MSVTMQFVDDEYVLSDGASGSVMLDINDGTSYRYMLDTFLPKPASQRQVLTDSPFMDGQQFRPGLDKLENMILPLSIKVIGTDANDRYTKAMALLNAARDHHNHFLFCPNGGTAVTFYDIVPPAEFDAERYWQLGWQTQDQAVISFEMQTSIGYGTVHELVPLRTVGSNDSWEQNDGTEFTIWTRTEVNAGTVTVDVAHYYGDGAAACKLVTTAGGTDSASVADSDFKAVDETHHFGAMLKAYENSGAPALDVDVACYANDYTLLGTLNLLTAYNPASASAWFNALEVSGSPVVYPSDSGLNPKFPTGTCYVKRTVRNDAAVASSVTVDAFWFGDTEYICGHKPSSIFGFSVPPGEIPGDLPCYADFYFMNAYASSAFESRNSGLPGTFNLFGVSAVSTDILWIVGETGRVYYTTNAGGTWTAQTSGSTSALTGVSAVDANTAWIVSASGEIIYTVNAGALWTIQDSVVPLSGVSAVNANVAWAVGDNGTILYTTNAGATWTAQVSGTSNYLRSVSAVNANVAWAVGDNGTILYTTNAGATWTAQVSGTMQHLNSVSAVDANTAWIVGNYGSICYTVNAGGTWTAQTSGSTSALTGVSAVDANTAWVCGDLGGSLYTANAGVTWAKKSTGITTDLNCVDAVSAASVWVVGNSTVVLKGVVSISALALTSLVMGERGGAYFTTYDPVKTPDTGTLTYNAYWRNGHYRAMAAAAVNNFRYDLASHSKSGYALSAGISFSATSVYDKGAIAKFLETSDGTDITSQEETDSIDLGDPNTKRKEVIFQTDQWDDLDELPNYLVPDDATFGNINQNLELTADAALAAVTLWIDSFTIIPTDIWTEIDTIAANCIIVNSNMGVVFDSLDGSPSTAMVHTPTDVTGTPRFQLDPLGVNMTFDGINDVAGDERVSIFDLSIKYRPRTKLHF